MAKSIYVATTESQSGKSLISLGLVELALRKTNNVGVFRPIIHEKGLNGERDDHLDLLIENFKLKQTFEDSYAFTRGQANELIAHGRIDELIETTIEKFKKVENSCDYIIVEGTDFIGGEGTAFEFDVNAELARNLSSPVLIVESASGEDMNQSLRNLSLAIDSFINRECSVLGVVVNKVPMLQRENYLEGLKKEIPSNILSYAIPENKILGSPTMLEIKKQLNASILYGEDKLDTLAYGYTIAAMHIQHFLEKFKDKYMVITPGDRSDIIMASLQAHISSNYPSLAGLVLTGGLEPPESIKKILDGLSQIVPILSVNSNTFNTALEVMNVQTRLSPENKRKIQLSLKFFSEYIDTDELDGKVLAFEPKGMTPRMFNFNLVQKAKSDKKHIVLPEGDDERILKAAENLLNHDVVEITLLGDVDHIHSEIERLGLKFPKEGFSIVNPRKSDKFQEYVEEFYQLRKHKGINMDVAADVMSDVSYFGTMMVYKGDADGMVSGAVHTTQHTIRPALQFVKTKPGYSVVSSVFFMCLEDRVLVYGDCAINPNPNSGQLAEIAISSAETSKAFGIEPKVAMLSYSSGSSGKGEEVEKVRSATEEVKEKFPDLLIEGPIQYDAAVDPGVGQKKMPGSKVAGNASVLIFPDLNTGNNTYKAVQRETGAIAIGPVLQGLNKPVNDLSRGCTVEDIINTVIITAIQAQEDS